jgi:glycosyltransferase involved in cell wall biosynthesis
MRRPIKDEFTDLPISRQRKYQLRKQREGRCTECGEPAAQGSRCLKHLVKARERQRKKRGLKRRYYNTLSYRLEAADERVTYLGQLERLALWRIMGQSLGLLFPAEWNEPFGLTAVESMATGTPVIAYRRGALEEIIRHGETGFLVEEGERAHAAALVDDLFDIPRAHCRAHVEANFALDEMIDAYERVYREAIKAHL